ncbi:MAG: recombination regulator RecX [Curvibacter sp.]|nr:recombination regulator RecX [Curvibacter sp.]
MGFDKPSLKGRALRHLALREHSRAELERKLAAHEESPGELKSVLDELEARGFIDAQRVVDSVLHQRAARLGSGRLRQELQAKGLDGELVRQALDGLRDSELARAHALWLGRFKQVAAEPQERARQLRFLLTRGFPSAVAQRVVSGRAADDLAAAGD